MSLIRWTTIALASSLCVAGCDKQDKAEPGSAQAEADKPAAAGKPAAADEPAAPGVQPAVEAPVDTKKLVTEIGVEPGPAPAEKDQGADAVIGAREGDVTLRRTGTESFEALAKDTSELRAGDQIRTAAGATATLTLPDQSTVEIAEDSAVAIGDRNATAEPGAAVAVLYGVARFTVAPRGEGEGGFLVYTPSGVVATKGTVYGVGVAADGRTRVGVETGAVLVAGASAFDNQVDIAAGSSAEITAEGTVGSPVAFSSDDWGEWRDGIEAEIDVKAAAKHHSAALVKLEAEAPVAYADLEAVTSSAAEAEAAVEASAEAEDAAAYEAAAPALALDLDASFAASVRLHYVTYAMLGHAYLATELYHRHPAEVEPIYVEVAPAASAAILWHKRYHLVVDQHVRPLRAHWYVHTPRGRVVATAAHVEVPAFYARVKLAPVVRADLDARLQFATFTPPEITVRDRAKVVVFDRPAVGWHAKVKVRPAPFRAGAGWYVRARAPRAHLIAGADVRVRPRAVFVVNGGARVAVRPAAVRISVNRPNIRSRIRVVTPSARVRVNARVDEPDVRARVKAGARVRVEAPSVKVRVEPPSVRARVEGGVRAGVGVRAGAGADGGARVRGGGGAAVRVKAPRVKVKAPSVRGKVKVKAGAGIKIN